MDIFKQRRDAMEKRALATKVDNVGATIELTQKLAAIFGNQVLGKVVVTTCQTTEQNDSVVISAGYYLAIAEAEINNQDFSIKRVFNIQAFDQLVPSEDFLKANVFNLEDDVDEQGNSSTVVQELGEAVGLMFDTQVDTYPVPSMNDEQVRTHFGEYAISCGGIKHAAFKLADLV